MEIYLNGCDSFLVWRKVYGYLYRCWMCELLATHMFSLSLITRAPFVGFEHFNSIYEIVMKNLEISTSHRDFFALFTIKEKQSTTISEHRKFFGCFSFIISLQREWNWIHFAWWMSTHSLWNISSSLFFFPVVDAWFCAPTTHQQQRNKIEIKNISLKLLKNRRIECRNVVKTRRTSHEPMPPYFIHTLSIPFSLSWPHKKTARKIKFMCISYNTFCDHEI